MAFLVPLGASIITGLTGATSMAVGAAPFAAAVGATAIGAAGYGAYAAGEALMGGGKEKSSTPPVQVQPLPTAPTPTSVEESAQALAKKRRKMRALAGGKTLLTSEAPVLGRTGGGRTLLGS